jgi:hypothetical protein
MIDIISVDQADDRGCALLQLWHKRGARVIGNSRHARALADAAWEGMLPTPRSLLAKFYGAALLAIDQPSYLESNQKAFDQRGGASK